MTATGFRHPNDRLSRLRAGSIYARRWSASTCALIPTATYSWFTEGFDTADLKDAKLLDRLSA